MAQEITILQCHNPRCGRWIAPLGEEKPCVCGSLVLDLESAGDGSDGDRKRRALAQYTLDVDMAVSCVTSFDLLERIVAHERRPSDISSPIVPLLLCASCRDWKVDEAYQLCSCGEPVYQNPPDEGQELFRAEAALLLDVNALMNLLDGEHGAQFREFVVSDYRRRDILLVA